MKKAIVITFVIFIAGINLYSQNNNFKPVALFGIRQGVNFSFVDFSPTVNYNLLPGYNGGLVFKYTNEKFFALQIELNYSQKGWEENLDTISNSYSRRLDYIELPFMTHIYLGNRNLKYFLNLGTSVAYLISEKESVKIGNELYVREYYTKTIENKFDFNIVGELGLTYNSNFGVFQFGARYYYTLTDIFEYTSESVYDLSRNQVINLSLTYFISSEK